MSFIPKDYGLSDEKIRQIQKVIDTLIMGGRSNNTIKNYVCAISRFLKYYEKKDISKFSEENIAEYIKKNYLNKDCGVDATGDVDDWHI